MPEPANPTEPSISTDTAAPLASEPIATEAAQEPAPPTDPPVDDGNEAAKYRRRLRDTEGQRDALAERLERLQRAEAERLAGKHLAAGDDLWLAGTQLGDLLTETGDIDGEKVAAAAQQIVSSRPHWKLTAAPAAPAADVSANGKIDVGPQRSWSDVLRGEPSSG